MTGFPSDETLIYSVLTNGIKNNPISKRDIEICQNMCKMTMTQSDPIDINSQTIELPPTTLTHYGNIKLAADVLHVNDVPFLTSISNHAHCRTCKAVDNVKAPMLEDGLKNIIRCYAIRGFAIRVIFLDL